ncbi:MAG: hypothetical protein ACTSYA_11645 [Candidatus Kariarchaeaceae archaeon]
MNRIWTSQGSQKLRQMQTMKIILNSYINLVDYFQNDQNALELITQSIKSSIESNFMLNTDMNINEQLSTFLFELGWKNSTIEIESTNRAKIVLGNNRFIKTESELDKTIFFAFLKIFGESIGKYILNSNVAAEVSSSLFSDNEYEITLDKRGEISRPIAREVSTVKINTATSSIVTPAAIKSESRVAKAEDASIISKNDRQQDYEPAPFKLKDILSVFIPTIDQKQLSEILFDVSYEFAESWIFNKEELNRIKEISEDEVKIQEIIAYLAYHADEASQTPVSIGKSLGQYLMRIYSSKIDEDLKSILEESIRTSISESLWIEYKARVYCHLSPNERCKKPNQQICDVVMGIYAGVLSESLEKEYDFTERIPARGTSDRFCLSEFAPAE